MVVSGFEEEIDKNTELYNLGIVSWFLYRYYGLNPKTDPNILRLDGRPYHMYIRPEWVVLMEPNRVIKKPLNDETYERFDDECLYKKQVEYIMEFGNHRGEQKNLQTLLLGGS